MFFLLFVAILCHCTHSNIVNDDTDSIIPSLNIISLPETNNNIIYSNSKKQRRRLIDINNIMIYPGADRWNSNQNRRRILNKKASNMNTPSNGDNGHRYPLRSRKKKDTTQKRRNPLIQNIFRKKKGKEKQEKKKKFSKTEKKKVSKKRKEKKEEKKENIKTKKKKGLFKKINKKRKRSSEPSRSRKRQKQCKAACKKPSKKRDTQRCECSVDGRAQWAKNIYITTSSQQIIKVEGFVFPKYVGKRGATPKSFNNEPTGGDTGYDGGHIFALFLGGPDVPENVVPQPSYWQQHGHWNQFENEVAKYAKYRYGWNNKNKDARPIPRPNNRIWLEINLKYNNKKTKNRIPVEYDGVIKDRCGTGKKDQCTSGIPKYFFEITQPIPNPTQGTDAKWYPHKPSKDMPK